MLIGVRMFKTTKKAEGRVVDLAKAQGGTFDDLSDKGPIFKFADDRAAYNFREAIRAEGLGQGFVKVWTVVAFREDCQLLADKAVEIAAFELGPQDLRRYVRVLHVSTDPFGLFLVEDFTKCDEQRAPSTFTKFANSTLAFQHALRLAQEEVADICDTEG